MDYGFSWWLQRGATWSYARQVVNVQVSHDHELYKNMSKGKFCNIMQYKMGEGGGGAFYILITFMTIFYI